MPTMRASEVSQKCLPDSLSGMHALRQRALLGAIEALLHGGRLTLIDLARAWPGATRVRALLKACDRLLCNPRLYAERSVIERDMAHWPRRGNRHNLSGLGMKQPETRQAWLYQAGPTA
ncbi:ISxac1 transposase [Xanthomonas oryzae pv. oryzae KACC 10331]|uniref:ISxac1 transposase n=1 Tax=Xanthomonas oryzae pv. oryzae (strain KACC10331 / KXO85) TaxID=291331 RepID=Q5GUH4_XANOR|nr:ISxac1 transposase [Xanthomonas oryzae pv. oryzae KACC 10331]